MKTVFVRELPKEERPEEKMLYRGAGALTSSELLALLIHTGTGTESALNLAEKVLALSGTGLGGLSGMLPEELETIPGIGPMKACRILAALELGRRVATQLRSKRVRLDSPEETANLFMEEMRHLPKEVFKVLFLNNRLEILGIHEVSVGDITSSFANPREVFREAIRKNACQIVAVHNHPSGNPEPSRNDILVTRRLAKTGDLLGIGLVDHLIIGDGEYTSLAQKGLIRKETEES